MREKLSEFVCAVELTVLRQSAAIWSVREKIDKLFIEVSLRNLYIISQSYLHNSHLGSPKFMATTGSICTTAYFLPNKQGEIINSKLVRFKNGLCRIIIENSNPIFP